MSLWSGKAKPIQKPLCNFHDVIDLSGKALHPLRGIQDEYRDCINPYDDLDASSAINKIVRYISTRGYQTENIFSIHIDPNSPELRNLRQKIKEVDPNLSSATSNIHIYGEILKQILARLPEPLLTFSRYDSFILVDGIALLDDKLIALRALLNSINRPNVKAVTAMLQKIANEPLNKMNGRSLAEIFLPYYLQPPELNFYNLNDRMASIEVLTLVIERFDILNSNQQLGRPSRDKNLAKNPGFAPPSPRRASLRFKPPELVPLLKIKPTIFTERQIQLRKAKEEAQNSLLSIAPSCSPTQLINSVQEEVDTRKAEGPPTQVDRSENDLELKKDSGAEIEHQTSTLLVESGDCVVAIGDEDERRDDDDEEDISANRDDSSPSTHHHHHHHHREIKTQKSTTEILQDIISQASAIHPIHHNDLEDSSSFSEEEDHESRPEIPLISEPESRSDSSDVNVEVVSSEVLLYGNLSQKELLNAITGKLDKISFNGTSYPPSIIRQMQLLLETVSSIDPTFLNIAKIDEKGPHESITRLVSTLDRVLQKDTHNTYIKLLFNLNAKLDQ